MEKVLKPRFKKCVVMVLFAIMAVGVFVVPIVEASTWSSWTHISRAITVRNANGSWSTVQGHGVWRHRAGCWDHHCTYRPIEAEARGDRGRGVAISNGHRVAAAAQGLVAHASTPHRLFSVNTSGWDLLSP